MVRAIKSLSRFIPTPLYLKIKYQYHTGYKLSLSNPLSFNEKLQWLKINDYKPEYVTYVDKYEVRKYITSQIGEEYLIPLIGVYNSIDEIDWDQLPSQFVIKCTHGSGSNIICADKSSFDFEAAKRKLQKWMKKNWYWYGRERPYKYIKPRIICEKYMVDESGTELKDYKFFCFNGHPKIVQVDFNRFTNHKRNLYDMNWNYIDGSIQFPSDSNVVINKPDNFDEMVHLAKLISKGFVHLRVDLYNANGNIFFGEMTFYHGSGFEKFYPRELELRMGDWINIQAK